MSESNSSGFVGPTEFDVRYYAGVLWRGRYLIATAAVVGLALGILFSFLQVPEYQAAAMLQIDPPTPLFMGVDAALAGGYYWQYTDFYNTQYKIMRSKPVGEEAARRLKLGESAAGLIVSSVSIRPIEESRLVMLQVAHTDPKEAALWANTVADVYIEQSLANRIEAAKKNYQWLQERLTATQQGMREAQEKLLKSYQTQDLFVPEGSQSAVSESITRLTNDYIEAQARRIALEAAFKQVDEMRDQDRVLDTVPQVAGDSAVAGFNERLTSLDLELTRLREKFKPAHPEIQRVQAELEQVREAKDARATEIVDGLRAEYRQLQKREAELKAAIDQQKAQAAAQSRKVSELEALKKEAESARGLYDVLLQKLNETDIASSVRTNFATLVERAEVPAAPVRPNKPRIAGMGLLLGLLLGVALVLGRDFLDTTLKDPDELERYLHVDLLAAVPRYDESSVHMVTEAYQNLRTSLLFGRKHERGQVVLITGTAPQEGKTTTLVNLGKMLASGGDKTILLDFDLRRAQLHSRFDLSREPGLTDFFVKPQELEALIRPTKVPNLSALTAGPIPPNPPAILARKTLGDLLDQLRERYEWILLDSPPLASVTDALLLARHVDLTLFVIQHNKVDKKLIRRSLAALRKVTPSLLGVVLNAVDITAKGSYYYYYYHHHYYRDEEAPAAKGRKTGPRALGARDG
jgi:capsular exopolysaccharide synthesis family protein